MAVGYNYSLPTPALSIIQRSYTRRRVSARWSMTMAYCSSSASASYKGLAHAEAVISRYDQRQWFSFSKIPRSPDHMPLRSLPVVWSHCSVRNRNDWKCAPLPKRTWERGHVLHLYCSVAISWDQKLNPESWWHQCLIILCQVSMFPPHTQWSLWCIHKHNIHNILLYEIPISYCKYI